MDQFDSSSSRLHITEPSRNTPLIRQADVLVVGGGLTGVAAAVASARLGAKTLLVERSQFLGGIASGSMPGSFGLLSDWKGNKITGGIIDEIIELLDKRRASVRNPWRFSAETERELGLEEYFSRNPRPEASTVQFDFEHLKFVCDKLVIENGVDVFFDTWAVGFFREASSQGVIAEGKSGRFAFSGKIVIDATGDADVAAMAGVSFSKGRDRDGLLQPASVMFTLRGLDANKIRQYEQENEDFGFAKAIAKAKQQGEIVGYPLDRILTWLPTFDKNIIWFNATRISHVDGTKTEDISKGLFEGRRQVDMLVDFLRNHIPGCEKAQVASTAPNLGIRETRRIQGDYVLSEKDVLTGRQFADVVVRRAIFMDVHNPSGPGFHKVRLGENTSFEIPYRCLLPRAVDNMLVAGRCVSTTHLAAGAVRAMVGCVALGEAAGTAAALSCRELIKPRELQVESLQEVLKTQGVLLD